MRLALAFCIAFLELVLTFFLLLLYSFLMVSHFFCFFELGMGSGFNENRDAYLSLSITVLAAFCRVPDIASSEDMILNIPLVLEVISTQ